MEGKSHAAVALLLKPGNRGANVHEVHEQLLSIGAVIASGELTATSFGQSTGAAVRDFRQQYGLPAGDILDLSTRRLMHAAAAFAGPDRRVTLRAAVQEAAADTSQRQESTRSGYLVTSGRSLRQVATWDQGAVEPCDVLQDLLCSRIEAEGRLDLRSR